MNGHAERARFFKARYSQLLHTTAALVTIASICVFSVCRSADPPVSLNSEQVSLYLKQIESQGTGAKIPDDHARALVEYLRSEFPYRSLRDRLAYLSKENNQFPRITDQVLPPVEHPLIVSSKVSSPPIAEDQLRSKSLELLHQMEVRKFIERNDFGVMRVRPPGPIYLRLENRLIPFDEAPDWSVLGEGALIENLPSRAQEIRLDDYINRPFDTNDKDLWIAQHRRDVRHSNPKLLPSRDYLQEIHSNAQSQFLSVPRMGHVVSVDKVAGFMGHGIDRRIPADAWDPRSQFTIEDFFDRELLNRRKIIQQSQPAEAIWLMKSMQLISLLKHETPVSYVSNSLPDMNELVKVPTRSLNEFESRALHKIESDHEIVIEARENRIQMVGAIRATEACLQCHQVKSGALLGAFTYDLVRNRDTSLDIYREAAQKWVADIEKLAENNSTSGGPDTLVCIGSSSFRIWDSIDADMAPHRVVRRAFGGSKYSDVAIHIDQLIADLNFRAALIYVGNDIAGKEEDRTPDEVQRLAAKVIERIRRERPSATVFLIAISPAPVRFGVWDKIQKANDMLKELAEKTHDVHFISTANALLDRDGKPREELFKDDRLHLNADGYRIWSEVLKESIEAHLP